MWRNLTFAVGSLMLVLGFSSLAQVMMPMEVKVRFSEVEGERTIYPVQDGPYPGRMVTMVPSAQGELRVEFINLTTKGEDYPAYQMSGSAPARVTLAEGGKLTVEFSEPFHYRYVVANDQTGSEEMRTGALDKLEATISEENLPNFTRVYLGAPAIGFVLREDLERMKRLAEAYVSERAQEYTSFPLADQLAKGAKLTGRPSLVKAISFQKPVSEALPSVMYPAGIPLKIEINPYTNELVLGTSMILGGPSLRTIAGLVDDIVGLDNNGTSTFGGPNGFQGLDRFVEVDLQDQTIANYISARAEIIRMRTDIEQAVKRAHGIPDFTTDPRPDPVTGLGRIMMVTAGSGENAMLNGFHAVKECRSIITGLSLGGPEQVR